MKLNRIISILYLLLFFTGEGELYAWTYPTSKPSNPFTSGDGSYSNPYEIRNAQDLANLAYMVRDGGEDYSGKHFVMTNDITLNENLVNADCTDRNTGSFQVWTPIGKYGYWSNNKFKGNFNGNSHTISGLLIEANDYYNGLFGVVDEGTIRNLTIADSYMCASYPFSSNYYGFIAGETSNATFLNCHVKNSCVRNIDNASQNELAIGGLVGRSLNHGVFSKCSFNGNFVLHSFHIKSLVYAGGILGYGNTDLTYYGKVKLYSCSTKGKFKVTGSPAIGVYGIGVNIGEAYGCVAGMDFDIQTHGEYYIGGNEYPLDVASFSYSSGRCTLCTTYGTIKVGEPDNPVRVQPLGEQNRELYNIRIGTFSSVGLLMKRDKGHMKDQCAAYTNVELYLHDDSKGNAFITSFGLALSNTVYQGLTLKNCIVAGNHIIESNTAIGYNPVVLDYDNGDSQQDVDDDWEWAKGVKYCTYVNGVKDEGFYFKNENIKYKSITPEELKGDELLAGLNALSDGGNQWGRITTEGDLTDYPMPVICGGSISGMKGSGSQESPYLIGSEADLRLFRQTVEQGDGVGKYYKLTADIDMSEQPMPAIGQANPFQGTFDGNGHSINGLVTKNGYLFHYLQGTVKNLTLLDYKGKADKTGIVTSIACFVGGSADGQVSKPGYIKNCYVSGNIEAYRSSSAAEDNVAATGLCLNIYEPSTVENSYFKGSIKVSSKTVDGQIVNSGGVIFSSPATTYLYVGGLAGKFSKVTESTNPTAIKQCYASFTYECDETGNAFNSKTVYGTIANTSAHQNVHYSYYVCDKEIDNYSEKLGSESELNDKLGSLSGWKRGYYRPVVEGTKYYTATLPDESRTETYLDAIPEANTTHNFIMNVEKADDPYADKHIWQLPNVAVYVPSEKTDYIPNCMLDQTHDFKYTPTSGAATKGQLIYNLTQTDKGYHMICLPGVVERNDLPDGAKVMIIGKIQTVGAQEQVNVVMVDTIPAGVPCMLYVPTTTVTTGTTIPLVMRSGIVSTPTVNATYSDFKGTFSNNTNVPVGACTTARYSGDNNTLPCFVRNTVTTTAEPFTAWLEGATGNVQIVDYILLDEENEAMTVTLCEYNAKTNNAKTYNAKNCNIKMRRALKKDDWNTICLPYSLTSDEISSLFGSGTKVETFSDLEYNSETNSYTMKFSAATEITAGTPYLIKPSKDVSDNIYEIKDRTITCTSETYVPTGTSQTANNTTLTMQGEYNKRMITPFDVTESENIYVINGDKIYHVNTDVEMKGFHCYFVAKESTTGPSVGGSDAFSNAKVIHSDGTSTDLRLIDAEATGDTDAVYDLLGRKRDAQTKGLVIKNGIKVLK
ncbi:MAG: hypothetical protein SOZ29_10995 [Prevotella sp.]|nr:hypothetical protein [Prevotella sp.]